MTDIEFFEGEKKAQSFSWGEDGDSLFVECDVVYRWQLIKSRTLQCGNEKTISVKRHVGISKSQKDDIEAAVKSGLEAKGFAKFSAEFKARTSFDLRTDEFIEEEESFKIQAPLCGQKRLMVYQLLKEYRFRITDNRFFLFNKGNQYIPIIENTDHIWDRSPTINNIPECSCNIPLEKEDGLINILLGNLGISTSFSKRKDCVYLTNLNLELSAEEFTSLVTGGTSVESVRVPDYLLFFAGKRNQEYVSIRLMNISLIDEPETLAVEMVMYPSESGTFSRPLRVRVLKAGDVVKVPTEPVGVKVITPTLQSDGDFLEIDLDD